MPSDKLPFTQRACVHKNDVFVAVDPLSGYRRSRREDSVDIIFLEPAAADEALGRALLEALDQSRFVDPRDDYFFEPTGFVATEKLWHEKIMKRFRYKTKRQIYKNMRYCYAERREGTLSIRPYGRDPRPGYIKILPEDQEVIIPETRDLATVGAALALVLSRCKTF